MRFAIVLTTLAALVSAAPAPAADSDVQLVKRKEPYNRVRLHPKRDGEPDRRYCLTSDYGGDGAQVYLGVCLSEWTDRQVWELQSERTIIGLSDYPGTCIDWGGPEHKVALRTCTKKNKWQTFDFNIRDGGVISPTILTGYGGDIPEFPGDQWQAAPVANDVEAILRGEYHIQQ